QMKQRGPDIWQVWWEDRYSGLLKYGITERLAQFRRSHTALFQTGDYEPTAVRGRQRNNVLSFVRRCGNEWLLVVVPLHLRQAITGSTDGAKPIDWGNTRVKLPQG